jgi:hypothetical protein
VTLTEHDGSAFEVGGTQQASGVVAERVSLGRHAQGVLVELAVVVLVVEDDDGISARRQVVKTTLCMPATARSATPTRRPLSFSNPTCADFSMALS